MSNAASKNTTRIKVVIERDEEGYVAYPLGMKGVVVGQGESYEEALADVTSAIAAHVRQFGAEVLLSESPAIEAFIAEAQVTV
jgi:predicted RNase H-like HicB family nuclease